MPIKPPSYRPPGRTWSNEKERKAAFDRTRPSRHARGYDQAWLEFRAAYLRDHPICSWPGCTAFATEVHHIQRVRDRPDLRLVRSNVLGFCKPHHSSETASRDSFGRRAKGEGA
jgi:hypothetical protein